MRKFIFVFLFLSFCKSSWAFKDDDWTHTFFERCNFAYQSKVNWIKEGDTKFLRFTLADGQKGNCSRDKKRRKNSKSIPHWERSEISSGPDSKNKFLLRSGGHYKINLRVRFFEGFISNNESILQLYSECPWRGRCSPLLKLQSNGFYPFDSPSFLRTHVLVQREDKKKNNFISASTLNNYYQTSVDFKDKSNGYFSPTTHKGKWIDITFFISITPKKAMLKSRIVSDSNVWTTSKQTIDIPSGYPDPYIVLGLYRPGSDLAPNPTSTIDFDYIKISEIMKEKK